MLLWGIVDIVDNITTISSSSCWLVLIDHMLLIWLWWRYFFHIIIIIVATTVYQCRRRRQVHVKRVVGLLSKRRASTLSPRLALWKWEWKKLSAFSSNSFSNSIQSTIFMARYHKICAHTFSGHIRHDRRFRYVPANKSASHIAYPSDGLLQAKTRFNGCLM